jgi:cell volume regulation protein A
VSESVFVVVAGVLIAGTLAASVVAETLRLPALLLWLLVGMAAGSDGIGWIHFDNYDVARQIGTAALALILFDGGLRSAPKDFLSALLPGSMLAVGGTLLTALLTGVAASALLGLPFLHGLLLGSIVASTDGAAVFSLLRGSHLRSRLVNILEAEAGMNDPVAVLLVLGFIDWIIKPGYGLPEMASLFISEIGVGALAGVVIGQVAGLGMRRLPLSRPGMYPVATLATAAIAYGAAETLHGSGFLAVFLAGVMLSASHAPAKMTISIFHDSAAWFAQMAMFLTLGLLVFPSQLGGVWVEGTLLAVFLMMVARPLAVFATTVFEPITVQERALLSWAGLRGGVPVVLATYPVLAHVSGSLQFFNVVFVVVLISTLVQGATFEPFARRLGLLDGATPAAKASPMRPRALQLPWSPEHGNPAHPIRLLDGEVVEHLRRRPDRPGTLVRLDDGRHAITGATLTVGAAADLRRYALERLARTGDAAERAWWSDLAAALGSRAAA